MLKIKDDVSYQKLNSIGFKLDNFNDCYNYEYSNEVVISIDKYNKTISIIYITFYYDEGINEYDERNISFKELYEYCPKLKKLVKKVR